MRSIQRFVCLVSLLAVCRPLAAVESPLGVEIESFSLRDSHGQPHELAQYADREAIVVAFLGTECPLARLYAPRLAELAAQYGPRGVVFIGINSNAQDSITEIAAFVRHFDLTFPLLKDLDHQVADAFAAGRTPEVFVLDKSRQVRYRGRIDDQYGVGFQRREPTRRDLALALDALLAGEPVEQPRTEAPGCLIGRSPKVEPHGDVTYSNQIARILQNRCVICHRPNEVAPFALTDYEEVVGWAEMIREVVDAGRMPPWFADPAYGKFKNDCSLSEEEKSQIHAWIDHGCPQGDPSQLPPPAEFADGWRIPEPDLVVRMSDKPFRVPAEGVVDYQHFVVDLNLTEDKWLQAAEARPGNRAVVHHIVAFVVPPSSSRRTSQDDRASAADRGSSGDAAGRASRGSRGGGGGGGLASQLFGDRLVAVFAPGTPPWIFPEGTAVPLPKGSKLALQMHYTPNGQPAEDISYVGLKFADPATVKRKASSRLALNFGLVIPPGADNHRVTTRYRFRQPAYLLNLYPHMHLRGKSFRIDMQYPDGTVETLLNVPRYDFGWQIRYDLAEPKLIPQGATMHCVAHFDNSAANLANPDPTAEVRFGQQTWEEMMVGFFTTAPAVEDVGPAAAGDRRDDDDVVVGEGGAR